MADSEKVNVRTGVRRVLTSARPLRTPQVDPYAEELAALPPAQAGRGASHPQWFAITPSSAQRTTIMVLTFVVLLGIATWAFNAMGTFLFILLLAWLLSIAMEPPVLWLVRRGVRRGLATGLVMIVGLILGLAVIALFGQVFLSQLSQLGAQLPQAVTTLVTWANSTFHTSFDLNSLASSLQITPDKAGELLSTYGGGLLGIFGSLATILFDGLTILVFAYYFSADSPKLRQTIGSWLSPRYQRVFVTVWTISVEKTGGYVVSKVFLAALSGFFHSVFFALIGVPYWLPLGVFAGIVGQFIPTVGTYIGVLLPALFTLLDKPINAVYIAIFATIYQQVENYIFTPRISKRTMDVHPAVALGSVIAGAALFGPVGALIGIPLAAAALAILDVFSRRHELLPELAALEEAETNQDAEAKAEVEDSPARRRGEEATTDPRPEPVSTSDARQEEEATSQS